MRKGSANNVQLCCAHMWVEHKVLLGEVQSILSKTRRLCVCVCISGVTYELLKSQVFNTAVLVNMQCAYATTIQQLLKSTLMKNSHTVHVHGYLYCPDAYNNSVSYTHTFSW